LIDNKIPSSGVGGPTVWSRFSTLALSRGNDQAQIVSERLRKIAFVWRQGAAQQLR